MITAKNKKFNRIIKFGRYSHIVVIPADIMKAKKIIRKYIVIDPINKRVQLK